MFVFTSSLCYHLISTILLFSVLQIWTYNYTSHRDHHPATASFKEQGSNHLFTAQNYIAHFSIERKSVSIFFCHCVCLNFRQIAIWKHTLTPQKEICILHFRCVLRVISCKKFSKDNTNQGKGGGLLQKSVISSFLDD